MTAVRNQTTLDTLARAAQIVEFINQHGDKLGPIWGLTDDGDLHLDTYGQIDDRDTAGAYLTWFYLLDTPRIDAATIGESDALVSVKGRIGDRQYQAYGRLHGAAAAYLLGLPEPTVHALRNIQVGDVPAIDTDAVAA